MNNLQQTFKFFIAHSLNGHGRWTAVAAGPVARAAFITQGWMRVKQKPKFYTGILPANGYASKCTSVL
jgi:hypothetical protein